MIRETPCSGIPIIHGSVVVDLPHPRSVPHVGLLVHSGSTYTPPGATPLAIAIKAVPIVLPSLGYSHDPDHIA